MASKSRAATKTKTAASSRTTSSRTRVASKAAPVKAKAATKTAATKSTKTTKTTKAAKPAAKTVAAKSRSSASKSTAAKKPAAKAAAAKTAAPKTTAAKKPAAKPVAKTTAAAKVAKKPAAKPTVKAPASKATKPAAAKAKPTAAAKPAAKRTSKKAEAGVVAAAAAAPATVATGAAARAVAASIAEAAARKISSPIKPLKTPKGIAEKAAANRDSAQQKKSVSQRHGFKTNEHVVYPAHGVGKIIGIEEQEIAGMSLELFVIHFEKEKLTLRVPTGKLESVGLRKLAEDDIVDKSLDVLKGRARVKRTMWSRRAQEYITKINSGDLISIAEVVRDLYRSEAQPEQSYSERQLYEDALDRMAREVAAVCKLDERGAIQRITDVLSKSARSRREADDSATDEGDATQAA